MSSAASAKEPHRRDWLAPALCAALVYPSVGIAFAYFDAASAPSPLRFWRLAAWAVSAVTFLAHVSCEHRRASPLRGAAHVACAVALGALLLAIWVLVHARWVGATNQSPLAPLALILFPLVTGVPAFLVGLAVLAAAAAMRRFR
jgi:hypothetical protein